MAWNNFFDDTSFPARRRQYILLFFFFTCLEWEASVCVLQITFLLEVIVTCNGALQRIRTASLWRLLPLICSWQIWAPFARNLPEILSRYITITVLKHCSHELSSIFSKLIFVCLALAFLSAGNVPLWLLFLKTLTTVRNLCFLSCISEIFESPINSSLASH